MKVIVSFDKNHQGEQQYTGVGMNHIFIIDDKRITTDTGIHKRIAYFVNGWHKYRLNMPYTVYNYDNGHYITANHEGVK